MPRPFRSTATRPASTEGMEGASTRFAYKILSETFNFDTNEVAADPVHLLYVIEQAIKREQLPEDTESR